MNKYLGIFLIIFGLLSISIASSADEWGCLEYGSDGFCVECADKYALVNY